MTEHFDIFSECIANCCLSILRGSPITTWDDIASLSAAYLLIENSCKSPIEKQLGVSLIFSEFGATPVFRFVSDISEHPEPFYFTSYISPQVKIGKYTVDFLIVTTVGSFSEYIIIECDGHDFHEKTKQQAAHDKKRDRYFTQNGYKVLRFTGSEIYNTPLDCVDEIEKLVLICYNLAYEKDTNSAEAA